MKHKVIIFNSDEEFENFAINPYAQIDSDNNPYGDYSNAYRQCIEQGIEFIIMGGDSNSSINRRDVVSKRVLLPQEFRIAGRNESASIYILSSVSLIIFMFLLPA